ncbi:diphosphomevalonate decarboxylase [Aureisphaera sp. CAU 1614]|uniref:Diphosphomevalonate decarboxylase n=1 Tax=Halomarinibacterium sedimenti TaxID=2857106 RepID=A0A9X1JWC7_9FLAO|nr:diphosphomevalonate decarboxylase [Halomarinibacterium sedimenti]MBW2936903.1 diphosphomevalonate decarboxylase [Halomarinibacterium sedimenti]
MDKSQFLPEKHTQSPENGKVSWQSPSNIALVKYWGKYGEQLPKNASISFTLSNCHTKTNVSFQKKESEGFDFEVYLDGKREKGFEPKIQKFFERVEAYVPFLKNYQFKIETSNSFPHSSGIASSASGMSALACCLMEIEKSLGDFEIPEDFFSKKASFLARLGSGSACRSIEGPLVVWGEHPQIGKATNLYGVPYPYTVHKNFENYQDTILLVDKGEKQVSSTVGHNLMHNHPFAEQRFEQANENLSKLIPVLKSGNLSEFISIVESEALSLHAMMLTSHPYFILMKPNTLEIINRIWDFRKETGSKVCFTLDAGANVHVLFPEAEKVLVSEFIKTQLTQFCKNGEFIEDSVGFGAQKC